MEVKWKRESEERETSEKSEKKKKSREMEIENSQCIRKNTEIKTENKIAKYVSSL